MSLGLVCKEAGTERFPIGRIKAGHGLGDVRLSVKLCLF